MESSQYQPPVRRSLTDEELAARVQLATTSHSGVEALMDLLVAQEALRAQEDAEIEAWVERMEAEGSPEAIAALAKFQGKDFIPQTDQVVIVPEPEVQPEVVQEIELEVEVVEEVDTQPEVVVTDPYAWLKPDVPVEAETEEQPAEPFSWFTQPEPEDEVEVEETITVIEATVEETVHPEGTETPDDFERLIESAAAEEELTALEENSETAPSNILVPSDEHRNRRPLSQLLVWLGASATIIPLLLTWTLIGIGLSAATVVSDLIIGYLISGLLIAAASLAGKRSGLSTAVISRAVFGFWGNTIPLVFATIARWVLAALTIATFMLLMNGIEARIPAFETSLLTLGGLQITVGFIIGCSVLIAATGLALIRGSASRMLQTVLSIGAFALVVEGFLGYFEIAPAFSAPGNLGVFSQESLAGIALVVMVTGTLWIAVAPNLAKSIPMKPRGIKVFLAVMASNFLIPVAVGAVALLWLGPAVAKGSTTLPDAVMVLPQWARGSLVSGVAIALIYILKLNLKTAGLDFITLVNVKSKALGIAISSVVVAGLVFLFTQQQANLLLGYLSNVFVLVAILVAGWLGMLVADVALRRIAYHELSLTRSYGYYGKFNAISFTIWLVCIAGAVLLVPINLYGFGFTGMFASLIGLDSSLGSQAIGFVLILSLGMVLTLIARIPQIRKQEREVLAVESRREALNDIFVGQE